MLYGNKSWEIMSGHKADIEMSWFLIMKCSCISHYVYLCLHQWCVLCNHFYSPTSLSITNDTQYNLHLFFHDHLPSKTQDSLRLHQCMGEAQIGEAPYLVEPFYVLLTDEWNASKSNLLPNWAYVCQLSHNLLSVWLTYHLHM